VLALLFVMSVTGDAFGLRADEPFMVRELDHIPTSMSYENLLEDVILPAIVSEPESGGFSKIDLQRVSLDTDSHLWTGWWLDGTDLEDPFFAGAAAFHVPFAFLSAVGVVRREATLHVGAGGVLLESVNTPGLRVGMGAVAPNLGGLFPPAIPAMNALSGKHSVDRLYPPPSERRRFVDSRTAWVANDDGKLAYAAEITQSVRRFNDFAYAAPPQSPFAGTYDEPSLLASGALKWRGPVQVLAVGEYRFRQNLGSEDYYARNETQRLESVGGLVAMDAGDLHLSLLLKSYSLRANDLDFVREIRDPDGESVFPFAPSGHYTAASLGIRYTRSIFYIDGSHRFVNFSPSATRWSNALTFAGVPYGHDDWQSAPSFIAYGHDAIGVRGEERWGGMKAAYNGYFTATYAMNGASVNGLAFVDAGLKGRLAYEWHPSHALTLEPYVLVSKTPVDLTIDTAQHLDPNDFNGREVIASGEIATFGGRYTRIGALQQPNVYALALGFEAKLGKWRLTFQGLGKIYDHPLWLHAEGDSGAYDGPFFYLAPGDKHYALGNTPGAASTYTGLQAQIYGHGERWTVDISGSAYRHIGTTAFGIGPTANDIGVLDWSQANPNTLRFPIGNVEGDRAFTVKALFSGRIWQRLWTSVTVRYRDGKSFAYYDYGESHGQIAVSYATPKGSLYALSGPRQDAQINLDWRVEYGLALSQAAELNLSATFANLFDLGNELNEWSAPGTGRSALEQQTPRSLFVAAELRL